MSASRLGGHRSIGGLPVQPATSHSPWDTGGKLNGFDTEDRFVPTHSTPEGEYGRLYYATVDETGSPRFSHPGLLRGQPAFRPHPKQPAAEPTPSPEPTPPPMAPPPPVATPRRDLVSDVVRYNRSRHSFTPTPSATDYLEAKARGYRGGYNDFLAGK